MGSTKVAYLIEQCWHRVPGGTAEAAVNLAEEMSRLEGIELSGIAANHKKNSFTRLLKDRFCGECSWVVI